MTVTAIGAERKQAAAAHSLSGTDVSRLSYEIDRKLLLEGAYSTEWGLAGVDTAYFLANYYPA
jgi:hypothetical protein